MRPYSRRDGWSPRGADATRHADARQPRRGLRDDLCGRVTGRIGAHRRGRISWNSIVGARGSGHRPRRDSWHGCRIAQRLAWERNLGRRPGTAFGTTVADDDFFPRQLRDRNAKSMSIPLVDLAAQQREVADEVAAGLAEVFASTAFIGGKAVAEFETAYAEFIGVDHCVGVANGTDALELALRAVGTQPGDEVILPANTFI